MQKLIPRDSPAFTEIDESIQFTQGLIADINASVAHAQKIEHLFSLCNSSGNNIFSPGCKLVRDGTLGLVIDKSGNVKEIYVVMSKEVFAFAKPPKVWTSLFGHYKLAAINLATATVRDTRSPNSAVANGFEIVGTSADPKKAGKKVKAHVVCSEYLEKLLWIEDLEPLTKPAK